AAGETQANIQGPADVVSLDARALPRSLQIVAEVIDLPAYFGRPGSTLHCLVQLLLDRLLGCVVTHSLDFSFLALDVAAPDARVQVGLRLGVEDLRQSAEFLADRFGLPHQRPQHPILGPLAIKEIAAVNNRLRLELAIDTAIALLQSAGIPGQVEVEKVVAMALKVEPLTGRVGADQDTNGVFVGIAIEGVLQIFTPVRRRGTREGGDPCIGPISMRQGGAKPALDVTARVLPFCE